MKILSIDFDYFIDATREQRDKMFPGGIDAPVEASMGMWAERYINFKELTFMDLNTIELIHVVMALSSSAYFNGKVPVYITNSHKYAYYMTEELFHDERSVEIFNLDFHDDIYMSANFGQVCCGNWVYQLLKVREQRGLKTQYHWIRQEDSLMVPDMIDMYKGIEYEFDDVWDHKFDAVILCRSDEWTPPHLDHGFKSLRDIIYSRDHFDIYESESITKIPHRKQELDRIYATPADKNAETVIHVKREVE